MERRKKKPDKFIAGFLAILTAFSPAASVVPVYASELDGNTTSSITMDPDSVTVNETVSDGIVLDNGSEGSDGITVVDETGSESETESDGITIGDTQDDGINIGSTGADDGIDVQNPDESDDGIDIQDPESDGIIIGQTDEGITVDESGITIDPWAGVDEFADDEYFLEHPEEFSIYEGLYELDVDLRSVHGSVILTPVDSNDLRDQRVVRVEYSEEKENYVTVVTDGAGEDVYSAVLNDMWNQSWLPGQRRM